MSAPKKSVGEGDENQNVVARHGLKMTVVKYYLFGYNTSGNDFETGVDSSQLFFSSFVL